MMTAAPIAVRIRRAGRAAGRGWAATPLWLRLVAAVLVLVALALGAAGVATVAALHRYLLSQLDTKLTHHSEVALRRLYLGSPPGPGDRDRGDPSRLRLPSAFFTASTDRAGTLVQTLDSPLEPGQPGPVLPSWTPGQVARLNHHLVTVAAAKGSGSWRLLAAPLPDGSGSLLVATSLADAEATLSQVISLEVRIGGVVLVLLAGVGYLMVRGTLRPLARVKDTAEAIAAGDLTRRVPEHPARTEVGQLSGALNGMLAQIESAFRTQQASEAAARSSEERMRRFVADASHELRTPLTSIRGFAELYRQGAADDVPRLMQRIESEAARMGLLVEDLLLLARMDAQRELARAPIDLVALAADAVHDARALSPDRPVALELGHGDRVPVVLGDEARLRQVLGNLMTNALTHTPAGTPITIAVSTEPGWAVLRVADQGPGLSPHDAQRVFERFYRADSARTRTRGGTGLGLSIVAALTAAHGGTAELDTAPGAGAVFRIRLPLPAGEGGEEVADLAEAAPAGIP
ncbi:MAG TPA: HAMP domain-containing sensor histidine kinase [Pseudonocardiaceae bacterium]|nr:HAMP domain-containing sensor histidine kinase [Pseudonocardiaceae bacterium]